MLHAFRSHAGRELYPSSTEPKTPSNPFQGAVQSKEVARVARSTSGRRVQDTPARVRDSHAAAPKCGRQTKNKTSSRTSSTSCFVGGRCDCRRGADHIRVRGSTHASVACFTTTTLFAAGAASRRVGTTSSSPVQPPVRVGATSVLAGAASVASAPFLRHRACATLSPSPSHRCQLRPAPVVPSLSHHLLSHLSSRIRSCRASATAVGGSCTAPASTDAGPASADASPRHPDPVPVPLPVAPPPLPVPLPVTPEPLPVPLPVAPPPLPVPLPVTPEPLPVPQPVAPPLPVPLPVAPTPVHAAARLPSASAHRYDASHRTRSRSLRSNADRPISARREPSRARHL